MDQTEAQRWMIGAIEIQRVPYFDIGIDAANLGLAGVAETLSWSDPWVIDGEPGIGQAFWVIRSGAEVLVIDPCGASDAFLRSGPDAVAHQEAAFALLEAGGCSPASVTQVVLTHLDGIGMTALADGAPAGEEAWSPAFPNAKVVISKIELDHIVETWAESERVGDPEVAPSGARALLQLYQAGVVAPIDLDTTGATSVAVAAGVTLVHTGAHSPGHAIVRIESEGEYAVMVGHLALNPMHVATGSRDDLLHIDKAGGWQALDGVLADAASKAALVIGPLFPSPGAVRVVSVDPYEVVPAPG